MVESRTGVKDPVISIFGGHILPKFPYIFLLLPIGIYIFHLEYRLPRTTTTTATTTATATATTESLSGVRLSEGELQIKSCEQIHFGQEYVEKR